MNKMCLNFVDVLRKIHAEKAYTSAAIIGRNLSFKSELALDRIYPNLRSTSSEQKKFFKFSIFMN